jgi:hypothetical protein
VYRFLEREIISTTYFPKGVPFLERKIVPATYYFPKGVPVFRKKNEEKCNCF